MKKIFRSLFYIENYDISGQIRYVTWFTDFTRFLTVFLHEFTSIAEIFPSITYGHEHHVVSTFLKYIKTVRILKFKYNRTKNNASFYIYAIIQFTLGRRCFGSSLSLRWRRWRNSCSLPLRCGKYILWQGCQKRCSKHQL